MIESKYEVEIDLTERNSTYYHLADMAGTNKRILDVGCDTGYFGAALIERGNRCSGVEYVKSTAAVARDRLDKVLTADLEKADLVAEFGEGVFDVVIFADVLEHLRDPLPVLRNARRLLAPGGSVLISIPNVAHGDVRLALLDGRWDYTTTGLLDRTHTRFFTRSSIEPLLRDAGFVLADLRRTRVPMFHSEQIVRREDYPPELVARLEEDQETTTYQFVLKALPDDADAQIAVLANAKYEQEQQLDRITGQLQQRDAQIAAMNAELERMRAQLSTTSPDRSATPVGAQGHGRRQLMAARFPRAARVYRKVVGRA